MTTMAPMMVMMPTAYLRTDPRVHEPGQPTSVAGAPSAAREPERPFLVHAPPHLAANENARHPRPRPLRLGDRSRSKLNRRVGTIYAVRARGSAAPSFMVSARIQ